MLGVVGVVGGVLTALSLPPWRWWPLAMLGIALLAWLVRHAGGPARVVIGFSFGIGYFTPGLWWMGEFHVLGAAIVVPAQAAFLAAAVALSPAGRASGLALPAGLVLAEAARSAVPFGGVPMAGMALGQAGGPLAGSARLGGELLVLGITAVAGVGLAELARRRWAAGMALAVAAGVAVVASVLPDGGTGPALRTALVQGGGRRGLRAVQSDPEAVFAAHVAATHELEGPVDLVLWPEDVIDADGPIAASPEDQEMAALARRTGSTIVAGVTEPTGDDRFFNAAVVWSPAGDLVGRFDKVKRVPFGEYVPARPLVDRLADVSAVPRDAVAGRGSGLLRTPAAPLATAISYEVFFRGRSRSATRAGGRVVAVPTNTASYTTSQVPAQEVAAARLRAIESGRDLVQAAPTGYSAHLDNRGRVLARSALGRRQVLRRTVTLRSGRTVYAGMGDGPVLALAAAAVAGAWVGTRPRTGPRRT